MHSTPPRSCTQLLWQNSTHERSGGCLPERAGLTTPVRHYPRLVDSRVDDASTHRSWAPGVRLRGLDTLVAHQVEDVAATGEEIVGDDPPMAAPPDGLGAHDRGSALTGEAHKLVEAGGELVREGVIGVIVEALVLPISRSPRGGRSCDLPRSPPSAAMRNSRPGRAPAPRPVPPHYIAGCGATSGPSGCRRHRSAGPARRRSTNSGDRAGRMADCEDRKSVRHHSANAVSLNCPSR